MSAKSDATRARILAAAIREFAQHGIAGARVERIAQAADANKERIYAYFGDKRALFTAALESAVQTAKREFPQQIEDLPGSIGAMAAYAVRDRDILRLLDWARLERDDKVDAAPDSETAAHLQAIEAAQASGAVDPRWEPAHLLAILGALGTAWAQAPASLRATTGDDPERVRAAIAEAVRRIVSPTGGDEPPQAPA